VEADRSIDFGLEIFDIVVLSGDGPLQKFDFVSFRCECLSALVMDMSKRTLYSVDIYYLFELTFHSLEVHMVNDAWTGSL
jgi:hypothetical protein